MTDIKITKAPSADAAASPELAAADYGTDRAIDSAEALAESQVVSEYTVLGMNCEHCVNAVTSELAAVGGVTAVQVDLGTKKVTVGSTRQLTEDEVRAAVDEAGYELG